MTFLPRPLNQTELLLRMGIQADERGGFFFVDGKGDWGQAQAMQRVLEGRDAALLEGLVPPLKTEEGGAISS